MDNGSHDGSVEYLKEQHDVIGVYNEENQGFPRGCNQGLHLATGSELMLLNNDVIVTPRWLEQLRLALYSSPLTGAVGCVTNKCSNYQIIDAAIYPGIDELFEFAEKFNHSDRTKWKRRLNLIGFCYLFKREVYEKVGDLDEAFSPGNYEDDDYSLRIGQAGYQLLLCEDTFIHHFGGGSFLREGKVSEAEFRIRAEKYNALLKRNFRYFQQKWQMSDIYYEGRSAIYESLDREIAKQAKILLIGDGLYGWLAYMLEQHSAKRICHLLLSDTAEADMLQKFFFVRRGNLKSEGLAAELDEQYDYIVFHDDFAGRDKQAAAALLNGLQKKLLPQGRLWFHIGREIFRLGQNDAIDFG